MTRYGLMAAADSRYSSEYLRLTVRACEITAEGTPRNLRSGDYPDRESMPFCGITVTAQADRSTDGARDYAYAWRFGLESDEPMRTDVVAAALATLRKVDKALERDRARYGPAATFGAHVARIATALGLPILTGQSGPDGMYSSGQWVEWSPGDAVSIIDGWTRAHRKDVALTV